MDKIKFLIKSYLEGKILWKEREIQKLNDDIEVINSLLKDFDDINKDIEKMEVEE